MTYKICTKCKCKRPLSDYGVSPRTGKDLQSCSICNAKRGISRSRARKAEMLLERDVVMQTVHDRPGLNANDLAAILGIPLASMRNHLTSLNATEKIQHVDQGKKRLYYSEASYARPLIDEYLLRGVHLPTNYVREIIGERTAPRRSPDCPPRLPFAVQTSWAAL